MRVARLACAATLAAGVLLPGPGAAQLGHRIVITPYAGAYLPSTNLAKAGRTETGADVATTAKQQAGPIYGATASYWLTDRFGFEAGAAFAVTRLGGTVSFAAPPLGALRSLRPTLRAPGVEPVALDDNAHVWLGSARMMVQLLPLDAPVNLRLGLGPAVISRGGTAYEKDAYGTPVGLTDVGLAASLCTRVSLTNTLALRLRAEDFIYRARLARADLLPASSYTLDARTQHDVVLSAGLQLFMNR